MSVPTASSDFPKMGETAYDGLMNMSGQRSPYTIPQARKGPTSPDTGGENKSNRSAAMLHEGMGPTFRPVASKVQGSEYPETGRGMRTVPSSVGNRDFWASRGDYAGETIG